MPAGQAQKEFALNQSLSVIDALLSQCISGSMADPPSAPVDGATYRITAPAQGAWVGHEDQIALWIGGAWSFVTPGEGMTVFDRGTGALIHYQGIWQTPVEPAEATGGSTIDSEARQMLVELVEALRKIGVFPTI